MSSLVADHDVKNVPRPIVDKLRAVIRRARTVLLVRGVLAVLSIALLGLLAGMAVDTAFTIFSVEVRVVLSLTILGIILLGIYAFLLRPLARGFSLTGVARNIEEHNPELQERISSAVELLTSKDATELKGSEALIGELAKEAVGQVGTVSPEKEYTLNSARPYLITAIVAACVLLMLFVMWPSATSRLVNRVVAPFANIGNVQATDLEVRPGDVVVAEHDSLRIEVIVPDTRVDVARVRRLGADRVETTERMKPLSADERGYPRFFLSIPDVTESFQYRVHSGGALSRYYNVKIVPRPAVEAFQITYGYPSYMSRSPREVTRETGDIEGPVGSQVTVVATTNTTIKSAQMAIAGLTASEAEIETDANGISRCKWQLTLTDDLAIGRTWTLQIQDEHGFMNWPTEYLIKAVRDKAPTIVIVDPSDNHLRLKRTDTLPIQYRAEDDFGIAGLELLAAVDGRDQQPRVLELPRDFDSMAFNASTLFDLSELTNVGSRTVSVQLRAKDNLPTDLKGPHSALSNVVTITLDETSESFFEKESARDYASIRDVLQRVLAELVEAETQTKDLETAVKPEGRLEEPTLQRIDKVRDLTGEAEEMLRDLGDALPTTSFAALTDEVVDLADTDVASARESAGQIKLADLVAQRTEHSRAADKHAKQAVARTEKLIADLDQLWKKIQDIADLKELADRQEDLAEMIASVNLDDLSDLPLIDEQLEVANEIAEEIKAAPDVFEDVLEKQKQDAEDLVKAAEKLAEKQADLKELTKESTEPEADSEALKEKIAEAIAKEQEQIANDAAKLDEEIEDADKAGDDKKSDLADKPEDVVNDIKKGDIDKAADDAEKAVDQFEKASDALAKNEPVPENNPADSENGKPQKGEPQKSEPQNGDNPKETPQDGKPQEGNPQKGEPEKGNDPNAKPQEGKPQDGNPDNGKPNKGEPQPNEPSKPEEGKPQDGKPQLGDPQKGEPTKSEPQNGDTNEGDPQNGEPENPEGDPQDGKPMPTPAEQAEQNAALAEKATDLAKRQEKVAEQLKALEKGQLAKAMELMQEQVAEKSADLAQKTEALAQVLKLFNQPPQAQTNADTAAAELEKATAKAGEAEQQLAKLTPQPEPAAGKPEDSDGKGEPANNTPPADEPTGEQPKGDQPKSDVPKGDQPAGEQPAGAEPPADQLTSNSPEAQAAKQAAMAAQQEAAQALTNAAKALQNAANEIQAEPAPVDEALASLSATEANSGDLGEAVESAASAANALQQSSDAAAQAAAAQSSQAAAEALANAAQAAAAAAGIPNGGSPMPSSLAQGNQPPQGSPPSQAQGRGQSSVPSSQVSQGDGQVGRIGGTSDNNLKLELKKYGISAAQWTRLPGNLKNQIRQAESEGAPEEYRAMVRRYFRELARRGSSDKAGR